MDINVTKDFPSNLYRDCFSAGDKYIEVSGDVIQKYMKLVLTEGSCEYFMYRYIMGKQNSEILAKTNMSYSAVTGSGSEIVSKFLGFVGIGGVVHSLHVGNLGNIPIECFCSPSTTYAKKLKRNNVNDLGTYFSMSWNELLSLNGVGEVTINSVEKNIRGVCRLLGFNPPSHIANATKAPEEGATVQTKSGCLLSYRDVENALNSLCTKARGYSSTLSSTARRELAVMDADMELYARGAKRESKEAMAEVTRVWLSLDHISQQSVSSIYGVIGLDVMKDGYEDFFPMSLVRDLDLDERCHTDDEYIRFMTMYYVIMNVTLNKLNPKIQKCLHYRYVHKLTLVDVGEKVGVTREYARQSVLKCIRFIKSKVLCLTAFGSGQGSISLVDFGDNTDAILIKSGYKTVGSVYRNLRVIEANGILSEKQLGNVRKLLFALGYGSR